MNTRRMTQTFLGVLAMSIAAVEALAEDAHVVTANEEKTPWKAIIFVVCFVLGIALVAFMKTKRTHMD